MGAFPAGEQGRRLPDTPANKRPLAGPGQRAAPLLLLGRRGGRLVGVGELAGGVEEHDAPDQLRHLGGREQRREASQAVAVLMERWFHWACTV